MFEKKNEKIELVDIFLPFAETGNRYCLAALKFARSQQEWKRRPSEE